MGIQLTFVASGLFAPIFRGNLRIGTLSRRYDLPLVGSRSHNLLAKASASGEEEKNRTNTENARLNPIDTEGRSGPVSTPKRKISRTEEIAAKLGKSRESLEAQRDKVIQDEKLSVRKKYGLAFLAVILAVTGVLAEKFDPNSGTTLLRYLQSHSPPVEIVGNGTPSVIEFSATWCENCRLMAKSIFDLENEYAGRVNFVVIDADNPDYQEMADKYEVDGIPQFTLLDGGGQNLASFVGFLPKTILSDNLNAILDGKELPHAGFSSNDIRQNLNDS